MKKKWLIVLLVVALGWGAISTSLLVNKNKAEDTKPDTEPETAAVAVTDIEI